MEEKEIALVDYVISCLQKGVSYNEIKTQLQAVGWSEDEIDSSYAISLKKIGVPAPEQSSENVFVKKSTTVEIVLNFFSFILLGVSAISTGILLFGVINYFFKDNLNNYYYSSSSATIHYAIASLLIGFPIYCWVMGFWFKKFREDEGKIESRLTRWITYLVLLIASITILGDLIVVIFNMLQGELTIRFFLKALSILIISGVIFSFYFLERKVVQYKKDVPNRTFSFFFAGTSILLFISIVLGFFVSGSPKTERMRTFDNTRANDLMSLASCISSYANDQKALPKSLNELKSDSRYAYCANKKDPEGGLSYVYTIKNESVEIGEVTKGEFELCADFSLSSLENGMGSDKTFYMNNSKWYEHGAGLECDLESVVLDRKNDTYQR